MKLTKEDLRWAVSKGLLEQNQLDSLWNGLEDHTKESAPSQLIQIFYYIGAMIILGAMTFFMTSGWDSFTGLEITLIALTYFLFFFALGYYFWHYSNLYYPGGLLFTLAVCTVPLILYGIEKFLGPWAYSGSYEDFFQTNGSWLAIELGTFAAGLIVLRFINFPFLIVPTAISGWAFVVNFANYLAPNSDHAYFLTSLAFGLFLIIMGYCYDKKAEKDYSFWLYLIGLVSFYVGLFEVFQYGQAIRFLLCVVSFAMILLSVILNRTVFLVFGAFGIFAYLANLAWGIFANSILFPFALSFFGVAIIFFAIFYNRYRSRIEQTILRFLRK
jgi:hypothetical protein